MKKQKGFTLIELLVVIAIIGLLATIAIVALNSTRGKARDAKRIADVTQLEKALEVYANSHQDQYPIIQNSFTSPVTLGTGNTACLSETNGFTDTGANCVAPLIALVPSDPSPNGSYRYIGTIGTEYAILFTLESGSGSFGAGNYAMTQGGIIAVTGN